MAWFNFLRRKGTPTGPEPLGIRALNKPATVHVREDHFGRTGSWTDTVITFEEPIEITGGTSPFEINIMLEPWHNLKGYTTAEAERYGYPKQRIKLTNNNFSTYECEVKTIFVSFYSEDISGNALDQKMSFTGNIIVTDAEDETASATVTVNFVPFFSSLQSKESISYSNPPRLAYKEHPEQGLHIALEFNPPLTITTALTFIPRYDVDFPNTMIAPIVGAQVKNFERTIESFPLLVQDEEAVLTYPGQLLDATLSVHTCIQTLTKKIPIRLTDLKRHLVTMRNPNAFSARDLAIVRIDKKENFARIVENKIFSPRVIYGSPGRGTVHFTLNHVVRRHGRGSWEDSDWAMVVPYSDFLKANAKTFAGGSTVDVFTVGFAILPKNTVFIERTHGENWEHFTGRVGDLILGFNCKVMEGGDYNWGDLYGPECEEIIQRITQGQWFTYRSHTYSNFGEAETNAARGISQRLPIEIQHARFRAALLRSLEGKYPRIFEQFKKQYSAWDSFWRRKHNIKPTDLKDQNVPI